MKHKPYSIIGRTITVKRSKWARGETGHDSGLLNSIGNRMCCLGFAARQCGYKKDEIKGISTPCMIRNDHRFVGLTSTSGGSNTDLCQELMVINDKVGIECATREMRLKSLAKRAKFRFKFID